MDTQLDMMTLNETKQDTIGHDQRYLDALRKSWTELDRVLAERVRQELWQAPRLPCVTLLTATALHLLRHLGMVASVLAGS